LNVLYYCLGIDGKLWKSFFPLQSKLRKLKTGILKVLAYFDLFDYPVSLDEIQFLMDHRVEKNELLLNLEQLIQAGCLFRFGNFYSLMDNPGLMNKRLEGNDRAKPLLLKAKTIADFLSRFPYVRGIAISGSLSKNYAEADTDIDFFIITKANRLWLARTILHLFKKLTYLTGHQHWYCMNYFIDEESLLIEEKNIFTATELITLVPVTGPEIMEQFFQVNDWARQFFPNYRIKWGNYPLKQEGLSRVRKVTEFFFNNKMGDLLENYFRKLTTQRWDSKEEKHKLNVKGNRMGLRTGKHFSKPNPVFFQEKLLNRYSRNMDQWERNWADKGIQDSSPLFLKEII
jgi:hypothetical protein